MKRALEFFLGETWTFTFSIADQAGVLIPMTGGQIKFRIANAVAAVVDKTFPAATVMSDPSSGLGAFNILPADQTFIQLGQVYDFELRAVLPDGTVSTQAYGTITPLDSLYSRFP